MVTKEERLRTKVIRIRLLSELQFLQSLPRNKQINRRIWIINQALQGKSRNDVKLKKDIFELLDNPNAIETRLFLDFVTKQSSQGKTYDVTLTGKIKRIGIASRIEAIQFIRDAVFDAFKTAMDENSPSFAQGLPNEPWTGKVTARSFIPGFLIQRLINFLEILDFMLTLPTRTEFVKFINALDKRENIIFQGELTVSYSQVDVFKDKIKTRIKGIDVDKIVIREKRRKIFGLTKRRNKFGPDFLYEG